MELELIQDLAPQRAREAVTSTVAVELACTAETAECTCPDFCERDHGNE